MQRPSGFIVVALCGILACGKDSSGPSVNLTGTWSGTINLSGSGVGCAISLSMQLTQTGGAFNGTYSNGSVNCNGQTQSGITGTIINGVINGSSVSFDVDDPAAHQTGTVSGNSMNGTARWTLNTQAGTVVLTGTWSATKP
jgi:hypothetical protein